MQRDALASIRQLRDEGQRRAIVISATGIAVAGEQAKFSLIATEYPLVRFACGLEDRVTVGHV